VSDPNRTARAALLILLAGALAPRAVMAQHAPQPATGPIGAAAAPAEEMAPGLSPMDGPPPAAGAHLLLTPARIATPVDSARAAAVVDTLRRAIARYHDVRVAEADGFRMFAPRVKRQRVYHYTSRRAALLSLVRFDPARPTSLLYERGADGGLVLIGAMYTAPRSASLEELDRRVPLGIARWHKHVNLCVPRWGKTERWREVRDGRPVFGPASPIATRDACEREGGRFIAERFGWMVHANVLAADDPAAIWTHGTHRHDAMTR
jgi:hypothetical protein